MNVLDAIVSRRNVRQFKPDPIDEDLLMSWFEAASFAPNHRLTEPWEVRFIGPETRAKLNHKANFGDAPVVFAVLSKSAATPQDRDEDVVAAACFIQNFLLAAHAAGVGARWSSLGALPANRAILGAPDGCDVIGVFGVGYPAEAPKLRPRTPVSAKVQHLP